MNAIRKKLLISSLKNNFKYQKGIDGILSKFIKTNTLESSFNKNDVFEVLLHLVETGDFFDNDFGNVIVDVWATLSNEQREQIFKTMFSEKNKNQALSFLMDSYSCAFDLFRYSMGELLYDISFLNSIPGSSMNCEFIRPDFQVLDYKRIISDDLLLDYYINETSVFESHNEYYNKEILDLTEEYKKKLIENGILWVIKSSELKNDIDFIENTIIKQSKKIDWQFIDPLPDNIKKNQRIILAILLSNTKNFDLLADKQTIMDNLYLLKDQNRHSKITNPNYILDKKLYGLATINDYYKDGWIRHTGIDGEFIWDLLTEEEKNIFYLTQDRNNSLDTKFDNIQLWADDNSFINKKKFYKFLEINNEALNLGVSNSQIAAVLNKNPEIIDNLAKKRGLGRESANNLYYAIVNDTLDVFLDFCDLGIADKVSMSLIKRDLIERVGYDIIRNVSIYPESFYHLLMLDKNGKLDIYKQMLILVDNLPLDKVRVSNILIYTCTSCEKFIHQMIDNNELTTENVLALINMTQSFSLINLNECNSIKEYYEKTNKFCDDNILSSINPLISRELLCQRFFLSGYNQIIEFYDSFASSIDKISDQNIRNVFEIIEKLKDCEDIEVIKETYKNLQQSNFKLDAVGLFSLTEKAKKEVIGDYFVSNTVINENQNKIIDFTGKEFNCLIHVMGAYGATVPADNMYESWNSNIKIDNTGICTSLLNENYFGHARTNQHSVILGFDDISSDEIQLMGPYDLYSNAYGLETFSNRGSKYYNSNDLINNARACYNEVVINRNLPGGQKRQPSYILCFDTINRESKRASEQFGIPIVFVDVKKHLEIKLEEIESLKQSYASSQSVETMKKIINMQETMRCGLLANNNEIAQNLFNSENITSNILFLIENSKDIETLNELEILLNNEKDRVNDKNHYINVEFNGDLDLIFEQLNIKKQKISNSNILSNFKEVREIQMQQDQIVREQQLSSLVQEMVQTKEGHSLK